MVSNSSATSRPLLGAEVAQERGEADAAVTAHLAILSTVGVLSVRPARHDVSDSGAQRLRALGRGQRLADAAVMLLRSGRPAAATR
jgi:hypothetical protein